LHPLKAVKAMIHSNQEVVNKIAELYADLYRHDGFGSMSIDMKIHKRDQKEIILKCGCEYRFLVEWSAPETEPVNVEKRAHHVGEGSKAQCIKPCKEHAADAAGRSIANSE
jgi:hypothetical protein